jgi:hypothetical protein
MTTLEDLQAALADLQAAARELTSAADGAALDPRQLARLVAEAKTVAADVRETALALRGGKRVGPEEVVRKRR